MRAIKKILAALAFSTSMVGGVGGTYAYESGDEFIFDDMATRLMLRCEQMGGVEDVAYPAHVYGSSLTDAEAELLLDKLSVMTSHITAARYGYHGFMVRSVSFKLESNGVWPVTVA